MVAAAMDPPFGASLHPTTSPFTKCAGEPSLKAVFTLLDLSFPERISEKEKHRLQHVVFLCRFGTVVLLNQPFRGLACLPMTFISCPSISQYPRLFDFREFRFWQAPLRAAEIPDRSALHRQRSNSLGFAPVFWNRESAR
jgi:hypothetical protein